MFDSFDYKGEERKDFIRAAHGIMNSTDRLSSATNPHIDPGTKLPYTGAEVKSAGWSFGKAVRDQAILNYSLDPNFDNDRLHEEQLTYSMDAKWAAWDNPEVFAKNVPKWVVSLVVSSFARRECYRTLDALDDLQQFMVGNVKALIDRSDVADKFLYDKNRRGLRTILDDHKMHFNAMDADMFCDIIYVLEQRDLDEHLAKVP